MHHFEAALREEVSALKKLKVSVSRRLEKASKGSLRISGKRGKYECYVKKEGDKKNGQYLKKSEIATAKALAQRDYDRELLQTVERRIKIIEKFLKGYHETSLKRLYGKTHPFRRKIIEVAEISDEEYVKRWENLIYAPMPFSEGMPEYYTEKGERVRSKSEKIIADKLFLLGIPYRYEYPLVVGDVEKRPDFTILKMPSREVVYLEHFGRMDDMTYVENNVRKLQMYENNGIYIGVNLFITFETATKPLNTKELDKMLQCIFL